MLSNEHYTNFFLENFPQYCIGLGEKNWGPTEEWLPIDKVWIPGHAGLANHIAQYTLNNGFDPAFSHLLELDHGIMTVYYELDNGMKLPLVPIVQNCAVPPLVPVRRAYEFGKALGDAIRSYDGLERVAVVGAGGLSHWIGNPRVGDINEEFDNWFLGVLESGDLEQVLDMPNERSNSPATATTKCAAGSQSPGPWLRSPRKPPSSPTRPSTRGSPGWRLPTGRPSTRALRETSMPVDAMRPWHEGRRMRRRRMSVR